MKAESHRIDVHYHIIPEQYVQLLGDRGITGSTFVKFPAWTPQKALKQMDHSGVAAAITSLSTPGVWFGDVELARRLSRICNEFQAQMPLRMITVIKGAFEMGSTICVRKRRCPQPSIRAAS